MRLRKGCIFFPNDDENINIPTRYFIIIPYLMQKSGLDLGKPTVCFTGSVAHNGLYEEFDPTQDFIVYPVWSCRRIILLLNLSQL